MNKKIKRPAVLVPWYSYVPLIFALLFNTAVYTGSRFIAGGWKHFPMKNQHFLFT